MIVQQIIRDRMHDGRSAWMLWLKSIPKKGLVNSVERLRDRSGCVRARRERGCGCDCDGRA